jgi:hypothetical protein
MAAKRLPQWLAEAALVSPQPLPDVTLVTIDSGVAPELTRLAIADTLRQVTPFEVISRWDAPASLLGVFDALWRTWPQVRTSHVLYIEYDGWVVDGAAWQPDWLDYDWIGAPWPWQPRHQVGNGGFSLRSRRLLRFLCGRAQRGTPEDELVCRYYRAALERHGFVWPPANVAAGFAFERDPPRPSFGFHGVFNFRHVLDAERLAERKRLAGPYVRAKPQWAELEAAGIRAGA